MKHLFLIYLMAVSSLLLANPTEKLHQIFEAYFELNARDYPEWSTYSGDHRFNDQVQDFSPVAVQKRLKTLRSYLAQIKDIELSSLTHSDQINYELFRLQIQMELEEAGFLRYLTPLNQQQGVHIEFPQIIGYQPLKTDQDYENYFSRMRGFAQQIDDIITQMQTGLDKNIIMPKFIMEQVREQVLNVTQSPANKSVFCNPINQNTDLTSEKREKLLAQTTKLVSKVVYPAYGKLELFLRETYLPKCADHAGIWSWPNGKKLYDFLVRKYTTTNMSANEVHEVGLKEVARLRQEMEKLKDKIGFKGDIDAFHQYIKTDAKFHYKDKEKMMKKYREILDQVDTKLPSLFGILPQAPYGLKEIELYRAKFAPQAYYYPAPKDRSRPGYFYVNTYELKSRPTYTMTALALHEAVPGHHLQIAIAQELKNIPKFRESIGFTAFVEGWALYAESLGYEAGMYTEQYQHYGALTFEMWRACRLVVDTGIHSKKWTRQEAFDYMKKYTPNSDLDIRSEIDRYIAWPGQAIAYKIGELKIKALRRKAEKKLGEKFDLKEFHDQVLQNGAIPLTLLEEKVEEWMEGK